MLFVGILAVGVVAAMPFHRRDRPARVASEDSPMDRLQLRAAVPLQMAPAQVFSSGDDIRTEDEVRPRRAQIREENQLDVDAAPPALAQRYESSRSATTAPMEGNLAENVEPDSDEADIERATRQYRLRDGDTLTSIAIRFYGDASRAEDILEANRDKISDPDLLPVALEIEIPQLED